MNGMQISNLTKRYGSRIVLSDISLHLAKGQIYGIMGENGAGKSTLFRCVSGLEKHEGTVSLDDGTRVGYLNDTPYFYPLVTAKEFVEFSLKARNEAINEAEINGLNRKFRLPLQQYPSRYSMGMKKRLMLFILMLQHNDIYILDEPFNGLDLEGCILLRKWLNDMRGRGKLIIVSSHIISALTDICNEIFYIHQGRIASSFKDKNAAEIEAEIGKFIMNDNSAGL